MLIHVLPTRPIAPYPPYPAQSQLPLLVAGRASALPRHTAPLMSPVTPMAKPGFYLPPSFADAIPPPPFTPSPPPPHAANNCQYVALMTSILASSNGQLNELLSAIERHAGMHRGLIQSQATAIAQQAVAASGEKKASDASFWLGLVGDVLLVAASTVLSVFTGGATSFLTALAVANLAVNIWDCTAKVAQRYTGFDASLSAGIAGLVRMCGSDEKSAGIAGMVAGTILKLVLTFGNAAAAYKSVKVAGDAVRLGMRVSQVTGASAQMGSSVAGGTRAYIRYKSQLAAADESAIQLLATWIKQQIDLRVGSLDLLYTEQRDMLSGIREQLKSEHESRCIPFRQYA